MIGEKLAELRKQHRWSIQHIADRLGIAKSTYAGYESGYREPSLDTLQRLSALFDVSVDSLLGRSDADRREMPEFQLAARDPRLGVWFKELLDAPEERREELRRIWEIIKQRESARGSDDRQE